MSDETKLTVEVRRISMLQVVQDYMTLKGAAVAHAYFPDPENESRINVHVVQQRLGIDLVQPAILLGRAFGCTIQPIISRVP